MSKVVEYEQGTQAFLTSHLTAILPDMNTDLAAKVQSVGNAPAFTHRIGDQPNTAAPTLCTYLMSNTARRTADNQKVVTVTFNVLTLIPVAGDNTPMNFEMTRQVAAAHLMTLFDDDSLVLTPKINAGLLGVVNAFDGERGDLVDIWPRKMTDKITVVHGFEFPYALSFSLQTR